ncbi:hypothetical protein BDP27DRAFT_1006513 [Rhodocollybia butyracea]|uniref:Uncharacterized protein n=1 Tax=Rhodocollybia butyracea TaxID=206335 RepID=A0A9P5TV85_9AGAR|nr:hypothetical protein BDP27DRAFT_1006513 [Rhodocollybia butyracea]
MLNLDVVDGVYTGDLVSTPLDITLRLFSRNFFLVSSLATNFLTTVVIIYKSWLLDFNMIRHSGTDEQTTRSPYLLLVILVESGAIFCIIQVWPSRNYGHYQMTS